MSQTFHLLSPYDIFNIMKLTQPKRNSNGTNID